MAEGARNITQLVYTVTFINIHEGLVSKEFTTIGLNKYPILNDAVEGRDIHFSKVAFDNVITNYATDRNHTFNVPWASFNNKKIQELFDKTQNINIVVDYGITEMYVSWLHNTRDEKGIDQFTLVFDIVKFLDDIQAGVIALDDKQTQPRGDHYLHHMQYMKPKDKPKKDKQPKNRI